MRTTLTIDDDLAEVLRQRAREQGLRFEEAVNLAIRAGLGEAAKARHQVSKTKPHSFVFRLGTDLDRLGQLAGELEAEAFATSIRNRPGPGR